VLAASRVRAKGSVNESSGSAVTIVAFVARGVTDDAGEGIEPEGTIERTLGEEGAVGERSEEVLHWTVRGMQRVAFSSQALQSDVSSLAAEPQQCFCDELAFSLFVDVAHDAEEIARIDAVGERARALLGLEDRDAGDDRIERIARDGETHVPFGVGQHESLEGRIEKGSHVGALARFERLPRELLAATAFFEGSPCFCDLVVGGLDGVELGSR